MSFIYWELHMILVSSKVTLQSIRSSVVEVGALVATWSMLTPICSSNGVLSSFRYQLTPCRDRSIHWGRSTRRDRSNRRARPTNLDRQTYRDRLTHRDTLASGSWPNNTWNGSSQVTVPVLSMGLHEAIWSILYIILSWVCRICQTLFLYEFSSTKI